MPAFHVTESIRIDKPIGEVRAAIVDFNTWPIWSPWLCMERTCQVNYKGEPDTVGHGYSWVGEKVGEGTMEWMSLTDDQLKANLTFLKPFKSKADVGFNLTAAGDATDVEWNMDSSLPFFMFFMVNTMKGMIRMDYSRGLAMLKDYIESGEVHSRMAAEGTVDTQPTAYLGVTKSSAMAKIGDSMEAAFGEVMSGFGDAGITPLGEPLSIYHEMNVKDASMRYTAALPVSVEDSTDSSGLTAGEIKAGKAFKVVHTGPYRHLGNAWALAMSDMRHAKLKKSKHHMPYERYISDPSDTPDADLVTEIYIPLR